MHYLLLTLSALCLAARAFTHHARVAMRRRSRRVRRYAQNVRPARPNVIAGPVPLLATLAASRAHLPPPPARPLLAGGARRADWSWSGGVALVSLARPSLAVAG
ncbi:hypothetical protein [Nocardiopsis sp. ATB16-24]|uniref:hypothetical protein n=1 Tax=Nocardiopsis sp. ATB16-24 TaxID=3019555 RepID=UPI0025539861|nr:hypothetical protein [Nocardiopsis sp. ATB16-24]